MYIDYEIIKKEQVDRRPVKGLPLSFGFREFTMRKKRGRMDEGVEDTRETFNHFIVLRERRLHSMKRRRH